MYMYLPLPQHVELCVVQFRQLQETHDLSKLYDLRL
jgi:hypothetical protein